MHKQCPKHCHNDKLYVKVTQKAQFGNTEFGNKEHDHTF